MNINSNEFKVLSAANAMPSSEACNHYLNIAQMWYCSQLTHKMSAFKLHIPRIIEFAKKEKDEFLQLKSLQTLALISFDRQLHETLFRCKLLELTIQFFESSQDLQTWEACLVVLNQVCFQWKDDFKEKKELLRKFWEKQSNLECLCKCGNIEDNAISIIVNTFSLLTKIVAEERTIQENCARWGAIGRAYNLIDTHQELLVRNNCRLFLNAMGMTGYSPECFNEMHATICTEMCMSPRALAIAIWRLCKIGKLDDAKNKTILISKILVILKKEPSLEKQVWYPSHQNYPRLSKARLSVFPTHDEKNDILIEQVSYESDIELRNAPSLPLEFSPAASPKAGNDLCEFAIKYPKDPRTSVAVHGAQLPLGKPLFGEYYSDTYEDPGVHTDEPPKLILAQSEPTEEINNISQAIESKESFIDEDTNLDNPKGSTHRISKVPFFEQPIHIAVLHSCPLEAASLGLQAERESLEFVFRQSGQPLGVFFGVLTQQSLIACIQRGAQILHISGHGSDSQTLQVQDRWGGMNTISATVIREALEGSLFQLKLVFVSTCFSEQVAQAFVDLGVPHVVAVHSLVQINNKTALDFAQGFYVNLLGQKKIVADAFKNARAGVKLQGKVDCCCRHEGHIPDCACPYCKSVRCCQLHHSEQCRGFKQLECCQPDIPHEHSKKFLLLGKSDHKQKVLDELSTNLEQIQLLVYDFPSNCTHGWRDNDKKVLGRSEDMQNLIQLLHPEKEHMHDMVVLTGSPYVGCTTIGNHVAQFFTRPWYIPLFPGGVWWIDLNHLQDADGLIEFMAERMEIDSGRFQYRDPKTNRMVNYPHHIHQQIREARYSDMPKLISEVDDKDQSRYILFREHRHQTKTLRSKLPPAIYEKIQAWFTLQNDFEFPKEVWQDSESGQVESRRIVFHSMGEKWILSEIKKKCQGATLFIFDHLTFTEDQLQKFWKGIHRLITELRKVRILLICHTNICQEIENFEFLRFKSHIKSRTYRLMPISSADAYWLLKTKTRQLIPEYDFEGLELPQSYVELTKYSLFEWLSKAPELIDICAELISLGMPLSAVIECVETSSDKWVSILNKYKQRSVPLIGGLERWYQDALVPLRAMMCKFDVVREIWEYNEANINIDEKNSH